IFIVDTTVSATLTISNLLMFAPPASANTLSLFTTNTLTIFHNLSVGPGGTIILTNATIDLKGLAGGFAIDDGSIIISNGASFIATNALSGLDIGHSGSGSLKMFGGRLFVIDEEVATFPGDKGTLTI